MADRSIVQDDRAVEFGTLADQKDEAFYDDRLKDDDDDDISNPPLYGRENEIKTLKTTYESMMGDHTAARQIVFLSGYSGMGKTALVHEFVRQVSHPANDPSLLPPSSNSNKDHYSGASRYPTPFFISGKFGQIKSGDPFSALLQALNGYVLQLMATTSSEDEADDAHHKEELLRLQQRLADNDIVRGNDNYHALCETLMPALEDLLSSSQTTFTETVGDHETATATTESAHAAPSTGRDITQIKFVFQSALKAIPTPKKPLILFVDDLQWSDEASLQLLRALLKDSALKYVMFIGAYRSNEISNAEQDNTDKPLGGLQGMKADLCDNSSSLPPPCEIQVDNMSFDSVAQFIADSLKKAVTDVGSITEAVYSKTLGNAFFVKQALDELKRKKVIYYDVVTFQWEFGDVSSVELKEHISDDVVSMVQSKMQLLPETLQYALTLVAYTNHSFDLELCYDLLKANYDGECKMQLLEQHIRLAIADGLLIRDVSTIGKVSHLYSATFQWSHDRIREAACESVPAGEERDKFLLKLSRSLMKRDDINKKDWMRFTAARHLNSIPRSMTDDIEVCTLNICVGKIASSKGAFDDALIFFNEALKRLDNCTIWKEHYYLALELMNCAMESEQAVGDHQNALTKASEILKHARCLRDKKRAHLVSIDSVFEGFNMDYTIWIKETAAILSLYGIDIPKSPTIRHVQVEVMKFSIALRGRSILCFQQFPVATDEDVITQISVGVATLRRAVVATRNFLVAVLAYRLLRIALVKKVVTKELSSVVFGLTFIFRKLEKYKNVFSFGQVGDDMMGRFPSMENENVFVLNKFGLVGVRSYQIHYRDTIEPLLEINKFLLARGVIEYSFASAMQAMYAVLVASLPLNETIKSKLQYFEDIAASLGRETFVVVFGLLRQFVYNLEGGQSTATTPAELNGDAFREAEVQNNPKFEGATKKMNNREISIAKLHLAVYFNDQDVMEQMLDKLQDLPVFDICVSRQHFRVSIMGIASLILKEKNPKYAKWASKSISFFEKLSKAGSPNAHPTLKALKALDSPSVGAFDDAIQAATDAGLINMAALMSERSALFMIEKQQVAGACKIWLFANGEQKNSDVNVEIKEYVRNAFWYYHSWGALGKVAALRQQFKIQDTVLHEKPPSSIKTIRQIAVFHKDPVGKQSNERTLPISDIEVHAPTLLQSSTPHVA